MKNEPDEKSRGPAQAVWRFIAFVAARLLIDGEIDGELPEPTIHMVSVNLRSLAKAYVCHLLKQVAAAGPAGISLDDLCVNTPTPTLLAYSQLDAELDRLMVETVRQKFPTIFAKPLTIGIDGTAYSFICTGGQMTAVPVT